LADGIGRKRSDLSGDLCSVGEQQHGRDALYAEPGRHSRRLVDVDLDDPERSGKLD